MNNPTRSLPLIRFDLRRGKSDFDFEEEWSDARAGTPVRVPALEDLPRRCYAVPIEDETMAPVLRPGMIAVFSAMKPAGRALMNIFAVCLKEGTPLIRKVVMQEPAGKTGPVRRDRRKSFMTPTPLHIPGSRVSPIAESTHRVVWLKRLDVPDQLKMIRQREVVWMHPLVFIHHLE